MPTPKESSRESHGGHAMLCVGYSDPDRVFIVRNSWGPDWGDKGYCDIPYDYLVNPNTTTVTAGSSASWRILSSTRRLGHDTALIGDFDTELANMSEEDYGTLLDAMGEHPLELRRRSFSSPQRGRTATLATMNWPKLPLISPLWSIHWG